MKKFVLIVFLIFSGIIYGQVGISVGSTYTQNFDSMPTTQTFRLPENWKGANLFDVRVLGNYDDAVPSFEAIGGNNFQGTSIDNYFRYNFGAGVESSAPDRALGGYPRVYKNCVNFYTKIENTGSSSIKKLYISYKVEKYKKGTYSNGYSITMYHSYNGTAINWVQTGTPFTTSFSADDDNAGYASAPGVTVNVSGSIDVNIEPGAFFYLAWNYSPTSGYGSSSNAQALAIDDVSIRASGLPSILTHDFSNITMNGAQSTGYILNNGIDNTWTLSYFSALGVCWSTTPNPTIENNELNNTGTYPNISCTLTDIDPSQVYYVRAYGTNEYGTGYGEQKILKIAPKANLGTDLNNNSFTASWSLPGATSYLLDVATSENFETDCIEGYNNLSVSSTSQEITGLTAGQTYYYRVRAVNANGKISFNSNTIRVTTLGNNGNNGIISNTGNQNITIGNGTGIGEIQFGNITQTGNILVNHYNNPPTNYGTSLPAQVSNYRWVIEPNNNLVINEETGYRLRFEVSSCPGITEYADGATTTVKLYKRSNPGMGDFTDCGYLVYYNGGTVNDQVNDYLLSQLITTGFSEFVFGSESAFPVELSSFSAVKSDNKVVLNWVTATELNNNCFEIERKISENNWEKIGTVAGFGNSNSTKEYNFTDNQISLSGKYVYRLKQIDNDGKFTYSNVIEVLVEAPKEFELVQNYPNPFNPETTINYSIPQSGNVKLFIFNTLGEKITTLVDGFNEAGTHSVKFNAGNLPSGIYFYQINSGNFTEVKKMTLTK